MRGSIHHVEVRVTDLSKSKDFYEQLLSLIGYKQLYQDEHSVGWDNGGEQIWIVKCDDRFKGVGFHRKRAGLNHVAFRAESRADVDGFYKRFLVPKKVNTLYGSPKEFPEYGPGYYAVYFEDPDRIKLEFAHIG